jgi:methionyl-tRNA synthetase
MATALYVSADALRRIVILLQPFMPRSCTRLLDQLAVPLAARTFAAMETALVPGTVLPKPEGVFPRYVEAAA